MSQKKNYFRQKLNFPVSRRNSIKDTPYRNQKAHIIVRNEQKLGRICLSSLGNLFKKKIGDKKRKGFFLSSIMHIVSVGLPLTIPKLRKNTNLNDKYIYLAWTSGTKGGRKGKKSRKVRRN